jgi:hypothetical protein
LPKNLPHKGSVTRAFRNHLMPNSFDDDWYFNVRTMKKLGAK